MVIEPALNVGVDALERAGGCFLLDRGGLLRVRWRGRGLAFWCRVCVVGSLRWCEVVAGGLRAVIDVSCHEFVRVFAGKVEVVRGAL